MAPLQQGMGEARRDAHGALHHLNRPRRLGPGATVFIGAQPQPRPPLKIAMDRCIHGHPSRRFVDHDVHAHAIGNGRGHEAS